MAKRNDNEGSIRRRKDGLYEVRLSNGIDYRTGKTLRISKYAKTKEEAILLLSQMNVLKSTNQKVYHDNVTLGEWLDLCMDLYLKRTLKQSTRISYEGYAKRHFKPILGNIRLSDVTPRMLQEFYSHKFDNENLSSKTIYNMNLYLHHALSFAVTEGIIPRNPSEGLNLPRVQRPQIRILSRDEQAALMRASYTHRYGVFIRLTLATGLRMGELLGLQWEDIDFRTNMLYVHRSLNRVKIPGLSEDYKGIRTQILLQEPKTNNSIRSIPLIDAVLHDLLCWKSVQDADQRANPDTYVFSGMIVTNPQGGYIEPRTFSDYYKQILTMAGLSNITFHALRHTFATRAMEQGMDEKTVSILLGHYSVAFTMDTYAHVLDDHKWEGMKLMEDLYTIDQTVPTQQSYPIVLTPDNAGGYIVTSPDFPQLELVCPSIEDALTEAEEAIRNELLIAFYPPAATELSAIQKQSGQFVVQISI